MNQNLSSKLLNNSGIILFILALIVRIAFYFWGTPLYYGSSGYQLSGDFGAWARSIQNFVEMGQYTSDVDNPNGPFFRPPGYGFFLLPFYLIFGNWESAYAWIAGVQIVIDAFAVVILYKSIRLLTGNLFSAWVGGLMYTFYFFALGWTPVLYPEAPSLFFLIAGFYFFVRAIKSSEKKMLWYWLGFGMTWGIATLLRIQLLVVLLAPILVILWYYRTNYSRLIRIIGIYGLGLLLTYGLWPIRNFINYGKPVFIQELTEGGVWSRDCMSFFLLLKTLQVDHEPQFTQLLKKEAIEWPAEVRWSAADSAEIDRAVALMHECGRATQRWKANKGLGEAKLLENHCDSEVAAIWDKLAAKVKQEHPYHYLLTVPVLNLKKALFKSDFLEKKTPAVVLLAFSLRSLIIVLGIGCSLFLLLKGSPDERATVLLITLSAAAVYVSLSWIARHIEMRYLLQVDVLLLIPIAIIAGRLKNIFTRP